VAESARSSTAPSDVVQFWMAFDPSIEALLRSGESTRQRCRQDDDPGRFLPMIAEMFRRVPPTWRVRSTVGRTSVVAGVARVPRSPVRRTACREAQSAMQRRLGLKIYRASPSSSPSTGTLVW
jgi:hypothetical protein